MQWARCELLLAVVMMGDGTPSSSPDEHILSEDNFTYAPYDSILFLQYNMDITWWRSGNASLFIGMGGESIHLQSVVFYWSSATL